MLYTEDHADPRREVLSFAGTGIFTIAIRNTFFTKVRALVRYGGLYGAARPGRPRTHNEEAVAQFLRTRDRDETGRWQPLDGPICCEDGLVEEHGWSHADAVWRTPYRSRSIKLSTDPAFVDKVKDIADLYLNPPDHAVVLCVDEKSQIQASVRIQPVLPLGLDYIEAVTHDYMQHQQ